MNNQKMTEKLSVLIIEESEADFLNLKSCINAVEEFDSTTVWKSSYQEGVEYFKNEEIDICFLDAHLGEETGQDFLDNLKRLKNETPIILLGNQKNRDIEEISADEGINDYVLRQLISPELIRRSLRYGFESHKKNLLLKAQEEKYSKLFYNSIEAIFTADKDYKIIEANQSFKNLIGISSFNDFDFRTLFVGNDYELLFDSISNERKKNTKRTQIRNQSNDLLEVYISIASIESEEEEACYQGIIHDITELENVQAQINESNNLKLISRMARLIGHEVRNPLTNIMLATEELREDFSENEDALLMLNMILKNSRRISELIDNFLNSTRNHELQKKLTTFKTILEGAVQNCNDRILLRKIDFTTTGVNNNTPVLMDEGKVIIALTNILINAIEALETIEKPTLALSASVTQSNLIIEISDNGIGMTEEIRDNLFNPFYSSKQGGLGLGMTNVKKIVDMHQGTIELESVLGQGTTFTIRFPNADV